MTDSVRNERGQWVPGHNGPKPKTRTMHVPEAEAQRLKDLMARIGTRDDELRRERDAAIRRLVAEGFSVRAIAEACGLRHSTVLGFIRPKAKA